MPVLMMLTQELNWEFSASFSTSQLARLHMSEMSCLDSSECSSCKPLRQGLYPWETTWYSILYRHTVSECPKMETNLVCALDIQRNKYTSMHFVYSSFWPSFFLYLLLEKSYLNSHFLVWYKFCSDTMEICYKLSTN